MNKKLCHISFSEYPLDARIRRYTNELIKNGFEIFIICLISKNKKYIEKSDNLTIYRLPVIKKRKGFLSRLLEYLIFQILSMVITTYLTIVKNISIFQIHTLPDFLVFSCFFPKLIGKKIILDFHELFPEFMMQHKPGFTFSSVLIKALLFQEKLSFKFASEIIVFHDPAREILLKRIKYHKNVTTIMNGVESEELINFSPKTTKEFRLVYHGTINSHVNLSIVVFALSKIKNEYPGIYSNLHFYLYGGGAEIDKLKLLSAQLKVDNIHFTDWLQPKEMFKELELAGACILPPQKDIYSDLYYSVKLVEMINLKIPIIASRLKTYNHYYPDDCIVYFMPNNLTDLVDKIIFIYKNRSNGILNVYTYNACKAYQKYSWEIMKTRYMTIISALLKN